ncbi:hypothetical protein BDR05DRAFT_947656 [Suillus weaverae]|nr:hypothetical protein BDR05DRAFT_947656 [Suillus weaverae]
MESASAGCHQTFVMFEDLEALVVQCLFELSKANLSGTGYKMCKYNKLVPLQVPPQPILEYTEVIGHVALGEFMLLKHSCSNLLAKPWAIPENCKMAVKFFKVLCSHKETTCLNIEIGRLHAWMELEEKSMVSTIAALNDKASFLLAFELQRQYAAWRCELAELEEEEEEEECSNEEWHNQKFLNAIAHLDYLDLCMQANNFVEIKMTAGFEFVRCPGMFNPTPTFTTALNISEPIKNEDKKQIIKAIYSIFSESFVSMVHQHRFQWETVHLPKSMLESLDKIEFIGKPSTKDLANSSYIFPNPSNSTVNMQSVAANTALDVDWCSSQNSNDSSAYLSTQHEDWHESITSDGLSTCLSTMSFTSTTHSSLHSLSDNDNNNNTTKFTFLSEPVACNTCNIRILNPAKSEPSTIHNLTQVAYTEISNVFESSTITYITFSTTPVSVKEKTSSGHSVPEFKAVSVPSRAPPPDFQLLPSTLYGVNGALYLQLPSSDPGLDAKEHHLNPVQIQTSLKGGEDNISITNNIYLMTAKMHLLIPHDTRAVQIYHDIMTVLQGVPLHHTAMDEMWRLSLRSWRFWRIMSDHCFM